MPPQDLNQPATVVMDERAIEFLCGAGVARDVAEAAVAAQAHFPEPERKERIGYLICAAYAGANIETCDPTPFTLDPIVPVPEEESTFRFRDIPCNKCNSDNVIFSFAKARSADEVAFVECKACNATYWL